MARLSPERGSLQGDDYSEPRRGNRSQRGIFTAVILALFRTMTLGGPPRDIYKKHIDLGSVPPELREKILRVTKKPTFFLHRTGFKFKSNLSIYNFLLDHLPLSASLAKALKIESYTVVERSPGYYYGTDGAGLSGYIWEVYRKPDRAAYFATGTYEGSFIGKVTGSVFIFGVYKKLDSGEVENRLYIYIRVHSAFLRAIAATLKPLLRPVANRKLRVFIHSASELAELLASDPRKAYYSLVTMGGVAEQEIEAFKNFFNIVR